MPVPLKPELRAPKKHERQAFTPEQLASHFGAHTPIHERLLTKAQVGHSRMLADGQKR